jgi:hypothetical protein
MLCYWLDTQHAVSLLAKQPQMCEQLEHNAVQSATQNVHM